MESRREVHRYVLRVASAVVATLWLSAPSAAADCNGVWSQISTAHSPGVRSYSVAAYDRHGKRLLLFGGLGPNGATDYKNDVWQLTLGATPDWQQITIDGTLPSPRMNAAGVYDPVHDQFVVFGGKDSNGLNNETWVLSFPSNTWSRLDVGDCDDHLRPCKREGHSAVFNEFDGLMWVFGGQGCVVPVADNWKEQLTPAANTWMGGGDADQCHEYYLPDPDCLPEIRQSHSEIYDSRNHNVVVMGGVYEGDDPNCVSTSNTWQWYGHTCNGQPDPWTRLADLPGTQGRAGHRAVYDSLRARMLVFGGTCHEADATVAALSLPPAGGATQPAWSTLSPSGTPPAASTAYHAAMFDPDGDRMVVFDNSGQTWQLSFGPPTTTTDLHITSVDVSHRHVTLSWTQPAAVGACGLASTVSIRRHSGSEITDANWSTSPLVASFAAPSPGSTGSYTVTSGLSGSATWYLALKMTDGCGISSLVSNNDCVTFSNPPSICSDGGYLRASLPPEESPPARELTISAVRPNPTSNGGAEVSFTLVAGAPATLDVLDIIGRRVEVVDLAGFSPGPHTVSIGARLAPGQYRIRIRQGDRFATRAAIVVR